MKCKQRQLKCKERGGGVEALYSLDLTNEINKLNAVPQNNVICDKSK